MRGDASRRVYVIDIATVDTCEDSRTEKARGGDEGRGSDLPLGAGRDQELPGESSVSGGEAMEKASKRYPAKEERKEDPISREDGADAPGQTSSEGSPEPKGEQRVGAMLLTLQQTTQRDMAARPGQSQG